MEKKKTGESTSQVTEPRSPNSQVTQPSEIARGDKSGSQKGATSTGTVRKPILMVKQPQRTPAIKDLPKTRKVTFKAQSVAPPLPKKVKTKNVCPECRDGHLCVHHCPDCKSRTRRCKSHEKPVRSGLFSICNKKQRCYRHMDVDKLKSVSYLRLN